MTEQPKALRLAEIIGGDCAAELRRLHEEVTEQGRLLSMSAERELSLLARIDRLEKLNAELLEALSDIAYRLESSRIWGGMEWTYNPLHPFKYLPIRDKARAAIAKATGEQA